MLADAMNMRKLGEFFVWYRQRKNYSQRDLAELLGVDSAYIARVELGKFRKPQSLMQKIYKVLDHEEKQKLQESIKEDYINDLNNFLQSLEDD